MSAPRTLSLESELAVAAGLYVGRPYPDPVTAAARLRSAVLALEGCPVSEELFALWEAAALHLAGRAEMPSALDAALRSYCAALRSYCAARTPARHREQPPMRPARGGATHAHHSAPEDEP